MVGCRSVGRAWSTGRLIGFVLFVHLRRLRGGLRVSGLSPDLVSDKRDMASRVWRQVRRAGLLSLYASSCDRAAIEMWGQIGHTRTPSGARGERRRTDPLRSRTDPLRSRTDPSGLSSGCGLPRCALAQAYMLHHFSVDMIAQAIYAVVYEQQVDSPERF